MPRYVITGKAGFRKTLDAKSVDDAIRLTFPWLHVKVTGGVIRQGRTVVGKIEETTGSKGTAE